MEKKLVKAVLNKYDIKSTGGKSILVDDVAVLPRAMYKYVTSELAKESLSKDELLEYYDYDEKSLGEIVFNKVKAEIKKRKLAESGLEVESTTFKNENSFKFKNLFPILDVRSNRKGLYDTRENQISDLSYDAWEETVSIDKDIFQSLMNRRMMGVLEYDPYTYEKAKLIEFKEQEIYQFNSHIFPDWRFHEPKTPTPPKFFFSLMEHLFPNKAARSFVYYWMRNAIFTRNQTVLLLSSNMGTGKGTLTDIIEQLVGETNFQKQGEGFFQTRFNAELENKRVVFFDEVPIQKGTKEQLKLLCNNTIAIEKKGVDVLVAKPNYSSFIVANNYPYENKLLADDRRFSVPEITDTPLLEVFDEAEVNKFHRELQYNPAVVQNIGWWLKDNADLPSWDVNIPYKKQRYFYLVKESLSEWQKFTVDRLSSSEGDDIPLADLKDDYEEITGFSRGFPAGTKMSNFLDQYRELDGLRIGECVKHNGEYTLVPHNKYMEI